jgi:ComF family protein
MLADAGAAANNHPMLFRAFDDAVMPLRCVFCGTRTREPERHVCEGCSNDLPYIESPPPGAGSPFEFDIAPLAYAFPVDAAIKALKFGRKFYYVPAFAELLCAASSMLPTDIDAVLPVPLHWRRQWFRGFNQALEIGKPVAKHLGVPTQSGLNAHERARNLRFAFVVRGVLPYRHILIVDDVITTGTTMRQVAAILHDAGVRKISALAVARA